MRILNRRILRFWLALSILLVKTSFTIGQIITTQFIRQKADSIVISFWGEDNFKDFIRLDESRSGNAVIHGHWEKISPFNERLDFVPNCYILKYNIHYSVFDSIKYPIKFYLDSMGKLMLGFSPHGLIDFGNFKNIKLISKDSAFMIAQNNGFEKSAKKWEAEMIWHRKTDYTTEGHFVWFLKSYIAKPYYQGCMFFNCKTIAIDVKSGKIIFTGLSGE